MECTWKDLGLEKEVIHWWGPAGKHIVPLTDVVPHHKCAAIERPFRVSKDLGSLKTMTFYDLLWPYLSKKYDFFRWNFQVFDQIIRIPKASIYNLY